MLLQHALFGLMGKDCKATIAMRCGIHFCSTVETRPSSYLLMLCKYWDGNTVYSTDPSVLYHLSTQLILLYCTTCLLNWSFCIVPLVTICFVVLFHGGAGRPANDDPYEDLEYGGPEEVNSLDFSDLSVSFHCLFVLSFQSFFFFFALFIGLIRRDTGGYRRYFERSDDQKNCQRLWHFWGNCWSWRLWKLCDYHHHMHQLLAPQSGAYEISIPNPIHL